MTIFFSFTLIDNAVPENAIMYKQTLKQEQAVSLINQGVKPLGHSQQALTNIMSKLGVNISNTTTRFSAEELSVGDSILVLTAQHGCTEDIANAESKFTFTLWTRLV